MDGLSDSFGQLSTDAREWRPAGQTSFGRQNSSSSILSNSRNASVMPLSPTPSTPTHSQSVLQHTPPGRGGVIGAGAWKPSPVVGQTTPGAATGWNAAPPGIPQWPAQNEQQQQPQQQQPQPQQQQHLQQRRPDPPLWRNLGPADDSVFMDNHPKLNSVPAGPSAPPSMRSLHSLGLPDDLWRYYRDISLEAQKELEANDPRHKAVPPSFTSVLPLDSVQNKNRSSFGYPISTFKAVSREDGQLYCIRRVDNVRSVSHKIAVAVTERWTTATSINGVLVNDHPGVAVFYQCFLSNRAVFFLHKFYPGARSLQQRFFSMGNPIPLPEPMIWSCIAQLVLAIRTIHVAKLACRTLQLSHILCTGEDRVRLRINCLGVVDALEFAARKPVQGLQMEDMRDLGRIIISLATGTEITRNSDPNTLRRCYMFVDQTYSRELYSLMVQLLLPNQPPPSVFDIANSMSNHLINELEMQQRAYDRLENSLRSEYDSGRALRLLLKMGFVNERPELGMNRRWTESGDCYVLKLFRDYVFHQADGSGAPVMDLGHVVSCLNKLDAAEEERIVLSSRDGKTLMVVSYGEIARALESAYGELCNSTVLPQSLQY